MKFFGQIFSANSTQPDPIHVKDLQDAPKPTSDHAVISLLGMANHTAGYIDNFVTIAASLRDLTKSAKFEWNKIHQQSFANSLLLHGQHNVWCISISKMDVDASPVGVSAILSRKTIVGDDKVISDAIQALTQVEKK